MARFEIRTPQAAPENQVDLTNMGNAENSIERSQLHVGFGFLACFPKRRLFDGFSVLHEAGRQGPEPVLWLNGPAAEKDTIFPLGDASGHDARILIMDHQAGIADKTRQVVSRRDLQCDLCPTLAAIVHR